MLNNTDIFFAIIWMAVAIVGATYSVLGLIEEFVSLYKGIDIFNIFLLGLVLIGFILLFIGNLSLLNSYYF